MMTYRPPAPRHNRLLDARDRVFLAAQQGTRRPGVGLGAAGFRAGVTAEAPDQLAVVLDVEHGQALDGAQDQDLVAPEVGAEQDVAHPGPDRRPGVGPSLAEHDLDPAPDGAAMPAQVAEDPPPL